MFKRRVLMSQPTHSGVTLGVVKIFPEDLSDLPVLIPTHFCCIILLSPGSVCFFTQIVVAMQCLIKVTHSHTRFRDASLCAAVDLYESRRT